MEERMRKLLFFLGLLTIIFSMNSCGTTSLMGCDHKLGIEKDICIQETKNTQYRIWRHRELMDYKR